MSFDMSQFYQVFFEETEEHLANIESLLLEIDREAPDAEQLNAIFRAAHSIKGSSAVFGFSDLADLTHILESLLDRLRKGQARLSAQMVQTFLEAGDVLKAMLAAHRGQGEPDPAAVRLVSEHLEGLVDDARARTPESMAQPSQQTRDATALPAERVPTTFRVVFVPDPAAARSPRVLENLLAELRGLGQVEAVFRPLEDDLTPPWQLLVTTAEGRDAVGGLDCVAMSGSVSISAESAVPYRPDEEGKDDVCRAQLPVQPREDYGFFDDSFLDRPAATAPPAIAPLDAGERNGSNPDLTRGTGQGEVRPEVKAASEAGSMRVSVEKVDQMIKLVGELVITRAMLDQAASSIDPVVCERLLNGLAQLERNTRGLQESVMSMRMTPI